MEMVLSVALLFSLMALFVSTSFLSPSFHKKKAEKKQQKKKKKR